jgi:SAM-dependent methyltransferase
VRERGDFADLIRDAQDAPFRGWDFSWLGGRVREAAPPWSYALEAGGAIQGSEASLDIDTGGGEILAEMLAEMAPSTRTVVATEGYRPNVPLAAARLRPLGVKVIGATSAPDNINQYPRSAKTPASTSSHLPCRDDAFDVVIDRHSSYWPSEVRRVLRPGGTFVTQQRGLVAQELLDLPATSEPFDLAYAIAQLRAVGLDVLRAEDAQTPMWFLDVGALVYFLRAVPWLVPGFDVARFRPQLRRIDERIRRDGAVEMHGTHLLVVAGASS